MENELKYSKIAGTQHLKAYGQYFTNLTVARYMCKWACCDAKNMLDPAAGNSTFLLKTKELYPDCSLEGYELDSNILEFFGNPSGATLHNKDYLLNGWKDSYDAIVCNPPYNRFQAVANRGEILDVIYRHTGIRYSSYTNLYILFLIKSLHQLSPTGKLAYIIPTEFLNSRYGTPIKEKLLTENLLTAVINFSNDSEMFFNATTTSCILLVDHSPKEEVLFYNLESISQLDNLVVGQSAANSVPYCKLNAQDKWRSFLYEEQQQQYHNLKPVSDFCKVTRGIATGANEYFCMTNSQILQQQLPLDAFSSCICRSADIVGPIFTDTDFDSLVSDDKNVFVFDPKGSFDDNVLAYIKEGEKLVISRKNLPSGRNPWYSMEKRPVAPIWVSSACRNGMKFVRNLAGIKALTTFHHVYINHDFEDSTDVIFCYFLTPIAQEIIRRNRKELGNGLEKFQPSDLNNAMMLDITLLRSEDIDKIKSIYSHMLDGFSPACISELEDIFKPYLT